MPKNVLPDAARVLPKAGQQVWLKAFNEALDKGLPEQDASREAWAAVKRAGYSKNPASKKWSKMDTDFQLEDDGTFVMSAPLIKVDVQKRIVEGFATLDNVDQAKDVVESSASQEAFQNWFGNIREMHEKKAVGKAIDWKPDTYTDDEGNSYDGIWVRAKISKGAEDTWQKVLDGTLAGFSIGGATLEKQRDIIKDSGGETHQVWRITKYKLTELSLVDSPCNRLATISLIKSVDGTPSVEETVADGDIEKAYNGETGEFADLSGAYKSVVSALENLRDEAIRNNADGVVSSAASALCDFRARVRWESQDADCAMAKSDETTINKEDAVSTESQETLQENAKDDTNVLDISDEERSLFRKLIDFVKSDKVDEAATETGEVEEINKDGDTPDMNEEAVTKAIDAASEELTKSVDGKFEQIGESLVKIAEALEKVATADAVETVKAEVATQIEELAGRITAIENSGAVKKSGEDAGDAGEKIEKSDDGLWLGSILPDFVVKN